MSSNPPPTENIAKASRVSVTPVPTQNSSQISDEPEKTTKHYSNDEGTETSVKDYQIFITIMLTISIFGASTFAIIAGQMEDPAELWKPKQPPFTLPTLLRATARVCSPFYVSKLKRPMISPGIETGIRLE
ncbi:hypothetical protein GCG54_00013408 [Colletotrichum gloeosporioides]|uniref:Uncharacterized protein n=1 Tax=Colletotrichum gloeosporioides TaxID=474922 RepID=A0A8H4FJI9_COLGL|nr:uncharacterized protein GCG54_00013408 [Colletotrichum gloeosporioides]KAF3803299.1 hypothetical protein GCG54_00013408 [Colletotrichum gloeosporioides]